MSSENIIKLFKSSKEITIVALGDSLTYGWMVDKGYLVFLREILDTKYSESEITIINRGIPGDTAEGGLNRINEHVINSNPDLVMIQFALNDAYQDYSVETFKKNIISIIKRIKNKTSAEILLLTSSALQGHEREVINKYYQTLEDAAEEERVQIVLVHQYWELKMKDGIKFSDLVLDDLVHPSETGYRYMAEAIAEII